MIASLISPKELILSGLLFEINRRVLHPLGYAIVTSGDKHLTVVMTTDPKGYVYSDADLEDGIAKLRRFMKSGGYDRLARRYAALGYRTQAPTPVDFPELREGDDLGPDRLALSERVRAFVEEVADVAHELDRARESWRPGETSEEFDAEVVDAISRLETADVDAISRLETADVVLERPPIGDVGRPAVEAIERVSEYFGEYVTEPAITEGDFARFLGELKREYGNG